MAFDRSIFEPIHFFMERRMMIGMKQLAEGSSRGRWRNHVHVVLWTITFGLFISAAVLVLRRERWGSAFAGFVAAAVLFQVLTLVSRMSLSDRARHDAVHPLVVADNKNADRSTHWWIPRRAVRVFAD